MSTETITITKCDRCKSRMAGPSERSALDIDFHGSSGPPGGIYEDLCPSCLKAVANLLDRVFLRKKADGGGE